MHKIYTGKSPPYLNQLINKASERYGSNNIITPLPRIDLYKASFSFTGATIWNTVTADLKITTSPKAFAGKLFKQLINFKASHPYIISRFSYITIIIMMIYIITSTFIVVIIDVAITVVDVVAIMSIVITMNTTVIVITIIIIIMLLVFFSSYLCQINMI